MRRSTSYNISLTVLLSALFIFIGVFYFNTSYLRFYESVCDLWQSCKYFYYEIIGQAHITMPTVENYSDVLKWDIFLARDFDTFKTDLQNYCHLLISKKNFNLYLEKFLHVTTVLFGILAIVFLLLKIFIFILKRLYRCSNTKHNRDTLPLRLFKFISKHTYQATRKLIITYVRFLRKYKFIYYFWIILWVFHFNFASIAISFLAYFLYFTCTFKLETLYVQSVKLFIDLQVFLDVFPWWIIAIIAYILFGRFRKGIANMLLRRLEARNCGFIKELPIVSMTCGSMGKKKTTIITDMALSQEVMFRQKAFELIKANDMKFPFFPWIKFEMELRGYMEDGTVYNLASVKEFVTEKEQRYLKHKNAELELYGYDTEIYPMRYNDGLKIESIFDTLRTYAQLYFIYVIESSLIVSNYSIRTDNQLLDQGNFPMWATDFFPETTVEEGRYAHILDFDVLRLGKKVIENNPNAGSFEFGVVVISEVGKERGNVLDQKEMKKNNDETNQKNDLFNSWLKMCRHSATVDHYPFIKVFTDEQRPESWGADARDLCDIVNIVSSGSQRLALPFYVIEDMLSDVLYGWFMSLYYDFRFRRGDNTLLVHILKCVTGLLYKHNTRIYNKYGYSVSTIEKERGTMDSKIEKKKYFVINKKIYANRFSTDCFSDYFNDMAIKSKRGLADYVEYETERATVEELKMQNSYFINALYKNAGS